MVKDRKIKQKVKFLSWKSVDGREFSRLCIPNKLQLDLVKHYHEEFHHGANRTALLVQQRFYFPRLRSIVDDVVAKCLTCQSTQGPNKPQKHTLAPTHSSFPWEKVSIDLVGPLKPSSKGNTYILTARCCFTRWVEAIPIKSITAENVANQLFIHVISRFGMPSQFHSDRGTQFDSELFRQWCKLLGVSKTATPAYNPQSNMVERAHRDMKAGLRCMEHLDGDWEDHLPTILLGLRTAVCRSTGVTPFMALFGREAQLPLDLMYGKPIDHAEQDGTGLIHSLRQRLETIYEFMRRTQDATIKRQCKQYDKPATHFQVGDKVWLFTPTIKRNKGSKLTIFWTGPWIVMEKISDVVYVVKTLGEWNKRQLVITAGIDRLKAFRGHNDSSEAQLDLGPKDVLPFDTFAENVPKLAEADLPKTLPPVPQRRTPACPPMGPSYTSTRPTTLPVRPSGPRMSSNELLQRSQELMDRLVRIGQQQEQDLRQELSNPSVNLSSSLADPNANLSDGPQSPSSLNASTLVLPQQLEVQEELVRATPDPLRSETQEVLQQAVPEHRRTVEMEDEAAPGPTCQASRGRPRTRPGRRSVSLTPVRKRRCSIKRPTSLQRHTMLTRSKSREKRRAERQKLQEKWLREQILMEKQSWKRRKEELDPTVDTAALPQQQGDSRAHSPQLGGHVRPARVPEVTTPEERRAITRDEKAELLKEARSKAHSASRARSIERSSPQLRSSTPTRPTSERLEELNESLSTISDNSKMSEKERPTRPSSPTTAQPRTRRPSLRMNDTITVHEFIPEPNTSTRPTPFVPCQACLPVTDVSMASAICNESKDISMDEAMKLASSKSARERAVQLEVELNENTEFEAMDEDSAFDWGHYNISVGLNKANNP